MVGTRFSWKNMKTIMLKIIRITITFEKKKTNLEKQNKWLQMTKN